MDFPHSLWSGVPSCAVGLDNTPQLSTQIEIEMQRLLLQASPGYMGSTGTSQAQYNRQAMRSDTNKWQEGSRNWIDAIKRAAEPSVSKVTSSTVVRSRGLVFDTFLDALSKCAAKFWTKGEFAIGSRNQDDKKRVKYWASRLLEPTEFRFTRVTFIDSLDGVFTFVESRDVNKDYTIIPLGFDIWSTLGDGSSTSVDWSKVMFSFVPSGEMKKDLGKQNISVCFVSVSGVQMSQCSSGQEEEVRRIEI